MERSAIRDHAASDQGPDTLRIRDRLMRFAAIADVHGNHLALEAVLADIRAQGIDDIVNLGDMASGPLDARRTMES